jgi:hypothetical protein
MGSDRGRQRYGVVGRKAAGVVDAVAAMVDAVDPDLVGGRDAMDLVVEFSRLEHLASGGLMLAARKVAQTDLWKRSGHQSPAHWLSHVTGVSVGEAIGLLETAEVVESAPDTREALTKGEVSTRQAKAIARAEAADPAAARKLLDDATTASTRDTETAARRIVAAASTETPDEKAQRHRKVRRFRHGVDDDGMGWGSWLLPIAEHTRAVAMIEAEQAAVFDEKRLAGERESSDAYAADGLCRVLHRAGTRPSGRSAPDPVAVGGGGSCDDDWSFAKVIVNVDLAALDRGHAVPGERCEIPGQGPVPVPDVWRMIDGDAFVAAVTTRGTEISKVVHLGRRPTVLQRTALEHRNGATCSIEGCSSTARLEIDHVAEWAATKRTELSELAFVCGHHHDLKTHHGHTFGKLQPDGRRRLIPPQGTAEPTLVGRPPDLALHDGHPPSRPDPRSGDPGLGSGNAPPAQAPPTTATATMTTTMLPTTAPTPTTPTSVEDRTRTLDDRARSQGALFDTG